MTPERKPHEMPMLTEEEFEKYNERQETKVFDMFEDDLLEITQDAAVQSSIIGLSISLPCLANNNMRQSLTSNPEILCIKMWKKQFQ